MPYNKLTPSQQDVCENKATEAPFSGEYDNFYEQGTFICRKCNAPLFSSDSKFDAGCGWPAFDSEYPESLQRLPDVDAQRTEIQCANCKAHLGHEFTGEHLTDESTRYLTVGVSSLETRDKNVRECVNSLSIKFISKGENLPQVITG